VIDLVDPTSIPESRAQLAVRPCPVCGRPVEPLRAGAAILLEDGFRYLCSHACRARFVAGDRYLTRSEAPRASASVSASSTDPLLRAIRKKRASSRPPGTPGSSSEWTAPHTAAPEPPVPVPTLPLAIASVALVASAFATSWTVVGIAAVLALAVVLLALIGPTPERRDTGWLASGIAPLGATLAIAAAVLAFGAGADARLGLAGAAVAAACAVLRGWIDAGAARPLERQLASLRGRIPLRARVPIDDATRPLELSAREVDAETLRAGEEVIVAEGETVPVDGVVRAGEAYVHLHPVARAPVRRRIGDPVIAGARVADGVLRVLATRVGNERAVLRAARFGDGTADDAARVTRLTARGIQFAGVAVLIAGLLALVLGDGGGGPSMRLAAAAGVLLAIPLLALRRAAESPFVAAGATAAERGIVFQSARALDRAGGVGVVAICAHGTITEGDPEVVEIHDAGGEGAVDDALSLAAAAEATLGEHPIARAIVRHADRRGGARGTVRRATAVPGRGLVAIGSAGESIVVGSRQLLLDEGISVAALDAEAERAESRGLSVVFVGIDHRPRALIALRDQERPGARAAVQRLIDLHAEVLLLSGDHRGTVEALAKTLDVDHVKAELTPEERGAEVRRLREGGSVVATIGRAGYDEHALAAADVPVVLAAAGGPDGERAIALTSDDVRDAAAALWLASAARREATRAVAVAVTAGSALVVVAANGLAAPALIALGALAVDAFALPAASRLLHRIELRLPARG
jgi:Cu+-exporting ATPase